MTAYKPEYSQRHETYRRAKYKRVALDYDRDYYDTVLKPIAGREGVQVGTFIKNVVAEYIKNATENATGAETQPDKKRD